MQHIIIARQGGPEVTLDPASVLDLRSVRAGGTDWAPGTAIPVEDDPRIFHSLQGFMFTAGPDHRGHPEPLDAGEGRYPLHGSFSSHPAEEIEVDADGAGCRGRVPVRLAGGARAVLQRRWSIDENGAVHLADRLENTGDMPFPPVMLYHMNMNTRLFDEATRFAGEMLEPGGLSWDFDEKDVSVRCVPANAHAAKDGFAEVKMGPAPGAGGLTLKVRFRVDTLPYLQFWRNRAPGIHVFGIEPCSHPLETRQALQAAGLLTLLQPGESREYGLSFAFSRS